MESLPSIHSKPCIISPLGTTATTVSPVHPTAAHHDKSVPDECFVRLQGDSHLQRTQRYGMLAPPLPP